LALAFVGLGDQNAAFTELARACDERDPALLYVGVEPRFETLRADPRFSELLSQLRFHA
jgi:hypothetical protein